jgi:Ca-activated chloride channel family protein
LFLIFLVTTTSPSANAAEGGQDTLAQPLVTAVARLAENNTLTASDCAELAQTTITYGQRVKTAQQHPPENVVRDALQAVALGEKLAEKAADWPHLRQELEALLKKEEPPPEDKKPPDQDKKKQDQQSKQEQKKDQPSPQDQQKSDQEKSDQPPPAEPPPPQDKDAFGDMQEPKNQPPEKKPAPPPPPPGTQKVGGQQDKKPDDQLQNPELAMPLQKLEQVRNQDSPAKLQQLMQGQPQKPKTKGKDW